MHVLSVPDIRFLIGGLQVKHFDRLYCSKKRVRRLLDTGDRARGPINLPANRAGLQTGEH